MGVAQPVSIRKEFAMTRIKILAFCLLAFTFGIWSISADTKLKKAVTFSKDVAPIFYKHCVVCHRPNDLAPMSLLTYKEARPWARAIKEVVLERRMPPWHADPRYGEFSNDRRLTQQEIDTIVGWVDQGAKEGDPKDLPPAPAFEEGWHIGKPDLVLSMLEEHTVEAEGPDDYLYFVIPTNFKEDKWIRAAEIRPGNKRVVHHVIAFVARQDVVSRFFAQRQSGNPAAQSFFITDGTLRRVRMDAPVIDDGCSAAERFQSFSNRSGGEGGFGSLLAGYAPGRDWDIWPEGTAKKIPAGSAIIFQMHYSKTTGKVEKDRTSIGLIFAKEPPRRGEIITRGISNVLFKIPPGAENHQVTACMTAERDLYLYAMMPHMHLRGKDMKYEALYPDGRRETLLWVPQYDFNWQTVYRLKKPALIPKGTKLIVTAHFDNSPKNKYNPDPTKPVRWGDPTYDEMMIGWVSFMVSNQPEVAAKDR
jgi:hypothetical protein